MHSLAVKLTIAFVLIGLVSVLLFALLLGVQTRNAFERFVADRERAFVVDGVRALAERRGVQAPVDTLTVGPVPPEVAAATILADANGTILRGPEGYTVGASLAPAMLAQASEIVANGKTIGYVTFAPVNHLRPRESRSPLENELLQRVYRSALGAGLFAVLAGLGVSAVVARSFSRPITELTDATRAMAAGDLHQKVPVRTQDELGTLALSFNQMSADLARSTQSRRQMTADLAHDLRTPLSVLRGYTEGLMEGRISGSPRIYALLYDEVVHLQRLVEDLRTLSLADSGELALNRRMIDPSALLERAGLAHMQTALDRGLALRIEAAEGLPDVFVDTDRLTQVLNNLVANALRHTHEGEIVLAASASGPAGSPRGVILEVRDTGEGIPEADLPFVFERFYRADKSRTRASEDTPDSDTQGDGDSSGLGLAIARAIVETHGGVIGVTSTPGGGATFTIHLPLPAAGSTADASTAAHATASA